MNTICIMCPMGCPLEVTESNGKITVTGNTCKRGEAYGVQEYTAPKRVVTSLIRLNGGGVVSVKTSAPVDKSCIFEILNALKPVRLDRPVKVGDVIARNILDLGADIIATREA